MMLAYVALFKWLQASISCVLAGALVWALLSATLRWWPALLTRRAVWLAAQGVTAGAAVLSLMPSSAHFGYGPTVTLSVATLALAAPGAETHVLGARNASNNETGNQTQVTALHAGALVDADGDAVGYASGNDTPPLTLTLPALWALIYAAGLANAVKRLLRARRLWRGLIVAAQRLSPQDLLAHGAFSHTQLTEIARHRLTVMETDAAISPMLIGIRRPLLLLPRHLRGFSTAQQHMIVAHELHHWRARDPLCMGLATVLQTVFWFNPVLRWLRDKMEWALELACDQQVLSGRPQEERKQYAAALLMQWKAQTSTLPAGGIAFGGISAATAAARIRQMQQMALPTLSRAVSWALAALMAAVLAAGALLQPALAFSVEQKAQASVAPVDIAAVSPVIGPATASVATSITSDTSATSATSATTAITALAATSATANTTQQQQQQQPDNADAWRYPLDKMHVTGFFGVHRNILTTPHKGIDIAAPKGTPVHAASGGVVIAAGALTENGSRYGNTVIIDHGTRRSVYAHLNSIAVKRGAHIEAGQLIGAVGETGYATGPHLHFEVREGEQLIDPATMLANLDAYASKRALRIRRQQFGA